MDSGLFDRLQRPTGDIENAAIDEFLFLRLAIGDE
jgi:hypothetical protein